MVSLMFLPYYLKAYHFDIFKLPVKACEKNLHRPDEKSQALVV
jgi:hypothetical protein